MAVPEFTWRLAVGSDRDAVERLDTLSFTEGAAFRGVDALHESLGDFGSRWPMTGPLDQHTFYAVCVAEEIVGFASLDWLSTPVPMLTRIYVLPDARELGAGAALLRFVLAEAARAGHPIVDAVSLPGDRETKNLYERQGMKARLIIASANT